MPNPNIVTVASILGKTFSNVITTANALQVINEAGSSNVYKINTVVVSNTYNGSSAADFYLELNNAAGNGTATRMANAISVPAKSTLVVFDKATSFYLEPDTSLKANTNISNSLTLTISYEIIS